MKSADLKAVGEALVEGIAVGLAEAGAELAPFVEAIVRDRIAVEEAAASAVIGAVLCTPAPYAHNLPDGPCQKCGAAV